jgi:hypothetical protein
MLFTVFTRSYAAVDGFCFILHSDNSDLSLVITESGFKAQPLTADGFAFMWTGAKATYGVKSGKVCFETKVICSIVWFMLYAIVGS